MDYNYSQHQHSYDPSQIQSYDPYQIQPYDQAYAYQQYQLQQQQQQPQQPYYPYDHQYAAYYPDVQQQHLHYQSEPSPVHPPGVIPAAAEPPQPARPTH